MKNDTEEGMLLGAFTYDENGESSQTFELPVGSSCTSFIFYEARVKAGVGNQNAS